MVRMYGELAMVMLVTWLWRWQRGKLDAVHMAILSWLRGVRQWQSYVRGYAVYVDPFASLKISCLTKARNIDLVTKWQGHESCMAMDASKN